MLPSIARLAAAASRSKLLLALLLAAVFVRSLVPAGYMPAFSAQGTPVVLCTAQGAIVVSLDADGQPVETHAQVECPFAFALGMAAAPPPAGTVEFPAAAAVPALVATPESVSAAAATPFSARAPPRLV